MLQFMYLECLSTEAMITTLQELKDCDVVYEIWFDSIRHSCVLYGELPKGWTPTENNKAWEGFEWYEKLKRRYEVVKAIRSWK